MCGIRGLVNCGDSETLERMTWVQAHRGPDDVGCGSNTFLMAPTSGSEADACQSLIPRAVATCPSAMRIAPFGITGLLMI